ncbi:unnamed protein product, partial [Polarella glacialis]
MASAISDGRPARGRALLPLLICLPLTLVLLQSSSPNGPSFAVPISGSQSGLGLAEAYQELGLQVGSDISKVRQAFRRLARKYHPDLCSPDKLSEAGARFVAVKQAHDRILEAAAGPGGIAGARAVRSSISGFMSNMARGTGHHTISSGATHELWLDLRGDAQLLSNARQNVQALFWQLRCVVDELGASLFKEGSISAIVTDADSAEAGVPQSNFRTPEKGWDYKWMPLVLVDPSSGKLRHGLTQ